MLKTMQTYTVIINTKTGFKRKHGALKKKSFLFCTEFHQKSLTRSHTQELKGRGVCRTLTCCGF